MQVRGLGRANALEYLQRLASQGLGLGGVARSEGAAAQAAQRVRLVPGAGQVAGQLQRPPMALLRQRELAGHPVQRPALVERPDRAGLVADLEEKTERLLQRRHRALAVTRVAPHPSQQGDGVRLAAG